MEFEKGEKKDAIGPYVDDIPPFGSYSIMPNFNFRHITDFKFTEVPAGEDIIIARDEVGLAAGNFLNGGNFALMTDIGFEVELFGIHRNLPHNEDGVFKIELPDGRVYLAVADGVGGNPGGEIATALFLTNLAYYLKTNIEPRKAIEMAAGQLVRDYNFRKKMATKDPEGEHYTAHILRKMATCFVLAELIPGKEGTDLNYYWCGDSKGWARVNGQIYETKEHNMAKAADLTPNHPLYLKMKNTVNYVIGLHKGMLDLDYFHVDSLSIPNLKPGDTALLATDGLWDNMRFDDAVQMGEFMDNIDKNCPGPDKQKETIKLLSSYVREQIFHGGKRDNLTIIKFEL